MTPIGSTRAALVTMLGLVLIACGPDPLPTPVALLEDETEAAAEADKARSERPRAQIQSSRASVNDGNRPPIVRSLKVAPSEEDAPNWIVSVETEDPDGDEVELDIVWFVNGAPAARGEHTFDPTANRRGDSVHVEVTPHDGTVVGATAASRMIQIANAAPAITSQPPASMAGGLYRYMIEASDPDGDAPLRYDLIRSPAGMRLDGYTGELSWRPRPDQVGTHTVEIAVVDSRGAKSTQEFALPIIPPSTPPASPEY